MYPMDRKINLSLLESSNFKVEPTLWIACRLIAFGIASSPNTIMIITVSGYITEIARVKFTIKKYCGLVRLRKLFPRVMRDI
jgi:hypothetical protein